MLLLRVLQPATVPRIAAAARDPALPAVAIHYPGVTRLDCLLAWLRSAAAGAGVAMTPLPRFERDVSGAYV